MAPSLIGLLPFGLVCGVGAQAAGASPLEALGMSALIFSGAAQILAAANVLKVRSCSAYPAVGPDVTACGGTYPEIAIDKAHVDGNLVTAPAWPAHPDWLAKFLKVLGTRIES